MMGVVVWIINVPPWSLTFERLVSSCGPNLGSLRRWGFVGGSVSLRVSFDSLKTSPI